MEYEEVLARLRAEANPDNAAGMARYGITADRVYGVTIPQLRSLAKQIGVDRPLAQRLWEHRSRETRILASMMDDVHLIDEEQLERWVCDFDSWEVCDQCCMNLFERMPYAYAKCVAWSARPEEFVKRAGFVLMARLAVSDTKAPDERFTAFLPLIEREAGDERNYVKKAVNWALRQIGKRNRTLNQQAIRLAERLSGSASASARWVANDALRELASDALQARLQGW